MPPPCSRQIAKILYATRAISRRYRDALVGLMRRDFSRASGRSKANVHYVSAARGALNPKQSLLMAVLLDKWAFTFNIAAIRSGPLTLAVAAYMIARIISVKSP